MKLQQLTPDQDRRNLRLHLDTVATMRDLYLLTLRKCGITQAPRPNVPPWVEECFERFWKVSYAHAPIFKQTFDEDAKEQGEFVGFLIWWQAFLKRLDEALSKLKPADLPLSRISQKKVDAAWDRVLVIDGVITPEIIKEAESLDGAKLDMAEVISTSSPIDMIRFSEGFGLGIKGPSRTEDGSLAESLATPTYVIMFFFWRQIVEFKSVTHLHQVLVALFGRTRAGDKKRTEQICRRIGFKLRGRGRPIKTLKRISA